MKRIITGNTPIYNDTFGLWTKPPFPYTGNKSNRRYNLIGIFGNLFKLVNFQPFSFDPFGGSFYLSHLILNSAKKIGKPITCYINDYDGYNRLMKPDFREHGLNILQIVEESGVERDERLPPDICQRIDDYIFKNCPEYDPWFQRILTMYGSDRRYRRRISPRQEIWKGTSVMQYVPNSVIFSDHIDYKDFIKLSVEHSNVDANLPTFWVCDPPYVTYDNTMIMYGDGLQRVEFDRIEIVENILDLCPSAFIITFGFERNFDVDKFKYDDLHYEELCEFFPPISGFRINSRPEYTHIWYRGKLRLLCNKIVDEPIIDRRSGKLSWRGDYSANFDYDDNFGIA